MTVAEKNRALAAVGAAQGSEVALAVSTDFAPGDADRKAWRAVA